MATVGVRHSKVVTIPDDPNYPVGSDEWNENHVVTGLENVDNTSDVNKPVSTAQAAADAAVAADAAAGDAAVAAAAAAATALKANIASPALTGVPTAPTAAPGTNTTQISTTAFVQAAVAALIAGAPGALDTLRELADAINDDASFAATITTALALKAPLASPTFTGTPAAPTPTAGDNTTKLATTAFVAASYAPLASPALTGAPTAPTATLGDNTTKIATTAFVQANAGSGSPPAPQGRLTLVSATPVMTTTQSAKTTIFYTPYIGGYLPLYNGTSFTPTAFAELSVATTDTAKNPAAIGASKVNDWFVWSDAGTLRISHGPDWTSDTARSAGTALVMVNGILLNSVAITNGPAASRGTYVGTTRSNGSSQLDWIFGAAASGGTAGFLGVWNKYNQVDVGSISKDTGPSYTYSSTTIREARGGTGMQASVITGLAEDSILAGVNVASLSPSVASSFGGTGLGLDNTNTLYSGAVYAQTSNTAPIYARSAQSFAIPPQIGLHVFSLNELADGTNLATFNLDSSNTLSIRLRM